MEFLPFLQEMLGITTDFGISVVERIESPEKIIRITIKYMEPECLIDGYYRKIYDYAPEREWQHLNWFDYKCYIIAKLPRYIEVDNTIVTYRPNFAPKGRGYTNLFKSKVLVLLQSIRIQSKVAKLLQTTPYIVRSIMEDAVNEALLLRGPVTDFKNISIDEKSYKPGHEYATILMDSDKECIIDMHEGRKEKSLEALFNMVSDKYTQPQIEIVNIDMWQPYMNVIKKIAPQATIVHDKFHIVKKLNEALDKTRRKEVYENEILKNQKFNILKNDENRTKKQKEQFKLISDANLKTSTAWHIKENFKVLWSYINVVDGEAIVSEWIKKSREQGLYFINHVLNTIENHIEGVANAIKTRTTSALHENNNKKIQEVIANGRGFKSFERFRINALFYFGNLRFSH
jgi:transposase